MGGLVPQQTHQRLVTDCSSPTISAVGLGDDYTDATLPSLLDGNGDASGEMREFDIILTFSEPCVGTGSVASGETPILPVDVEASTR